jgi:hypothetical protein
MPRLEHKANQERQRYAARKRKEKEENEYELEDMAETVLTKIDIDMEAKGQIFSKDPPLADIYYHLCLWSKNAKNAHFNDNIHRISDSS